MAKSSTIPKVLEFTFEMERETKGTIRFAQTGVPTGVRPAVGTLYLTKEALAPMGNFKNIKVTVEPVE